MQNVMGISPKIYAIFLVLLRNSRDTCENDLVNARAIFSLTFIEQHRAGYVAGPIPAWLARGLFFAPCSRFPRTLCRTVGAQRRQKGRYRLPIPLRRPIQIPKLAGYLRSKKKQESSLKLC